MAFPDFEARGVCADGPTPLSASAETDRRLLLLLGFPETQDLVALANRAFSARLKSQAEDGLLLTHLMPMSTAERSRSANCAP